MPVNINFFIIIIVVIVATIQVAHQAIAYPDSHTMKQLGVYLLPPWIGFYSIAGLNPSIKFTVSIYTPVWREAQ